MNFKSVLFAAIISATFLASCSDDDNNEQNIEPPLSTYDNGVLILNQGNFNSGNAEISYLSDDFSTFQNGIFGIVNDAAELGDTGQDIGFYEDRAYIVVNHSETIEVVNRHTFKKIATITEGLYNPRYIAFANGKGYVTNWGDPENPNDDYVAVINLSTLQVTSTIAVDEGPERIIESQGVLYVAQTGGYNYGNSITVIDTPLNTKVSIGVGDVPNSLEVKDGLLYVLCGGMPSFLPGETPGRLVRISVEDRIVQGQVDFPAGQHPSNLVLDSSALFYIEGGNVFKTIPGVIEMPTTALISTSSQGLYGLEVQNGRIFLADAGDFNSNGKVFVYSTSGALEHQYTVGIIPSGFYFN